ncbi:hypothetical protein SETIT_8G216800v2 [Setaria italica]|uniref:Uncharacterized protein n=1 Tax=Setaria italica TaxID=4555 RepID=A0A368SA82_SETIT|nr:hypothetical protein SETIT_8G216800v2 [Setaria italica]
MDPWRAFSIRVEPPPGTKSNPLVPGGFLWINKIAFVVINLSKYESECIPACCNQLTMDVLPIGLTWSYLVIIDDIWYGKEWEIIRKALPKNSEGCKIIMTTLIKTTAEKCQTEQGAQSFGFSDAIRLSDMRLNNSRPRETYLKPMPLAGICLSSAWAESHVQGDTGEWDTLVSHLLGGFLSIPSMKPLVQSLCLYSDDLPLHLRTCLLYCGVFPPDYPIRMECLEVAEAYIDLLVSRNLLQPVYEESTYRVHLLMLGFLVCKAKEDNFVACRQYNGPSGSWHAKQIRHEDLSHNRSLVVCHQPQLDGVTLDKFANLRVLQINSNGLRDYSHLVSGSQGITKLPREIGRLQYLEILHIRWTYIGELPMEICKPQHLRILDACKANVRKLPSEIWKLQRLEILDASRTRVTELPTESLDVSWTGVRELHKEVWKLQHLRSLNISSTKVTELPTEITKLELLKDLDVSWTGVRELPKEIRKLQHFSTLDVRGTKVRELHWEIPNSLSVLVGDKISSEVVMLPQAVSADWVISSSGAERRDDLSIFVLMSNSGWSNEPLQLSLLRVDGRHKKVPQWVKQDLCKVCTLDIRLCKLALQLRFEVLPREPVAITGEGFLKLETFYVDCRLPRVITFKREAMPKLKHLEFKFYTGTASQDHYMGIEHLDSLEKVVFRCSEYYTSDGPGIRETIDVLRKEAVEHPNKITLWVNEHSV